MARSSSGDAPVSGVARIERVLALLLLEGMARDSQTRKVEVLGVAGFTNAEIAELLQTTPAVVSQRLYEARAAKAKAAKSRAAARPASKGKPTR